MRFVTMGTSPATLEGDISHHYILDSKAMRKVGPDDNIVGMCTLDGGAGALFNTNGRMLIQLH